MAARLGRSIVPAGVEQMILNRLPGEVFCSVHVHLQPCCAAACAEAAHPSTHETATVAGGRSLSNNTFVRCYLTSLFGLNATGALSRARRGCCSQSFQGRENGQPACSRLPRHQCTFPQLGAANVCCVPHCSFARPFDELYFDAVQGRVERHSLVRVVRAGQIIHEGKLADMRHVDEVVKVAAEGTECGLKLKDFTKIREGDVIEAFSNVERKYTMDEAKTRYLKKLSQMAKGRASSRP